MSSHGQFQTKDKPQPCPKKMNAMKPRKIALAPHLMGIVLFSGFMPQAFAESRDVSAFERVIQNTLNKNCIDCHDSDEQKGDVRLDNWSSMKEDDKLALIDRVMEQVYKGTMPPKRKDLLTVEQRNELFSAIDQRHKARKTTSEFKKALNDSMELPDHGNYVDHEKLFSGENAALPGFTHDRHWLISEFIFREKINAILGRNPQLVIDGKKVTTRGARTPTEFGNPFLLPRKSGVRYFSSGKLNTSHFLTMQGNAEYLSKFMVSELSRNDPGYLPAVTAMTKQKFEHDAIVAQRKAYLDKWVDVLCQEMYGSQNESLLPTYKEIPIEGINDKPNHFGKNGWLGRITKIYEPYIVAACHRFARKDKDRLRTIRESERYWFHMGHEPEVVGFLVDILRTQLVSIVEYKGQEALGMPKHPNVPSNEMTEIKKVIKELRKSGMSYMALINACTNRWEEEFAQVREKSGLLSEDLTKRVVEELYLKLFVRPPTSDELKKNQALLRSYAGKLGIDDAVEKLTATLILHPEFITRYEYGTGEPDQYGRRMLSPRDASYAIAYALTDNPPDAELTKAAQEGRLATRADYKREVERLLKDRSNVYIIDNDLNDTGGIDSYTTMPIRKLRFFREYFGYYTGMDILKDQARYGVRIEGARERAIVEADLLVEYFLTQDKNVFENLLTTDKFYVVHSGDNEITLKISEGIKKTYEYFKANNWKEFQSMEDVLPHKEFLLNNILPGFSTEKLRDMTAGKAPKKPAQEPKPVTEQPADKGGRRNNAKKEKPQIDEYFVTFINALCSLESKYSDGKKYAIPGGVIPKRIQGGRHMVGIAGINVIESFNLTASKWDYPPVQPAKIENRMGMLTHPAWLQAFAKNDHTDPVARGKWIQEKLLAGTVPEVPIGVDAVVPEDKTKTLRERFEEKLSGAQCVKCHQYMNPLGMPFEIFDDFGRYRTEEEIEHPDNAVGVKEISHHKMEVVKIHPAQQRLGRSGHYADPRILYKTKPVNSTGELIGTGNQTLDGDVKDAFDLIGRLAKSQRARQSIIRHAFRYFLGRNEMLSDSKTLIDAEQAYVQSGGSFDAVIVSLLTSDSFIYRKQQQE